MGGGDGALSGYEPGEDKKKGMLTPISSTDTSLKMEKHAAIA